MKTKMLLCMVWILTLVFLATQSSAEADAKPLRCMDPSLIDKSVDPCSNFYEYAYGNWIKNNTIPADQSRWWRFRKFYLKQPAEK